MVGDTTAIIVECLISKLHCISNKEQNPIYYHRCCYELAVFLLNLFILSEAIQPS